MQIPNPQSPAIQPASVPASDPQVMLVGPAGNQRQIAFIRREGVVDGKPGIVWLPGLMSDMRSTKASALDEWAGEQGRSLLRFDYSGHGLSSRVFTDGSISQWLEEALAVIRAQTQGPQILVGSSMGGWLSLLVARALAQTGEAARLHAMVLIAPAVDFTMELHRQWQDPHIAKQFDAAGNWLRPSDYGAPMPFSRLLLEDGVNHQLIGTLIRSHCRVHILQGMQDAVVPWKTATGLTEHLASDPAVLTLIRDGDHRLSRSQDIALLLETIAAMG